MTLTNSSTVESGALESHKVAVRIFSGSWLAGRQVQTVADPRFGQEVRGAGRLRFDLLSQLVDDHTKVVNLVSVVRAPDRLQKLAMGEHLVRVRDQVSEQLELLWREVHVAAARADLSRVEIDFNRPQRQTP